MSLSTQADLAGLTGVLALMPLMGLSDYEKVPGEGKGVITLVRVDDRLLHGQVIHAWVPATGSDTLLVVAGRSMRRIFESELEEIPGAETCEILVMDQVGAVDYLLGDASRPRRVLVVLPSIAMAVSIFRVGVRFGVLNLGNIHHAEFSERLSHSVVITEEEKTALSGLREEGVRMEVRALPGAGVG